MQPMKTQNKPVSNIYLGKDSLEVHYTSIHMV